MPLSYREIPETCTVELTIRGDLSQVDYAAIMVPMGAFIETCGQINVVEIVECFTGFLEAPDIPQLPVDPGVLSKVARVALVSDIGWFCPILSNVPSDVISDIKSFTLADRETAVAWATSRCA